MECSDELNAIKILIKHAASVMKVMKVYIICLVFQGRVMTPDLGAHRSVALKVLTSSQSTAIKKYDLQIISSVYHSMVLLCCDIV